jgi:O-antigen/teichoic acid export membrane protein
MKLKQLRHFVTTDLGQNISRLFTGTVATQLVSVLASWLLTRYCYTPEEYGVGVTFVALAAILTTLSTLRYELMIVLPQDMEESAELVQLSSQLVIWFFVFWGGWSVLLYLIHFELYSPCFTLLLPWSVASAAFYQIEVNYLSRLNDFGGIAQLRLLQVALIFVTQLCFDYCHLTDGLLWGWTIGNIVICLVGYFKLVKKHHFLLKSTIFSKFNTPLFKKYLPITRFSILSGTINSVATNLQPMLITSWFGAASAGWFSFVDRVWQIPIRIVQGGVSPIYYAEAAAMSHNAPKKIFRFSIQMAGAVAVLLAFPMFLASLFPTWWIGFFFGERWLPSAPYMQLLVSVYLLRTIFNPISYLAEITGRTDVELWFSLFFITSSTLSLGWGSVQHNFEAGLWAMALLNSLGYMGAMVYFLSAAYKISSRDT